MNHFSQTSIKSVVYALLMLCVFVTTSSLVGCGGMTGASGIIYSERLAPPDKPLIYVYREGRVLGCGGSWDLYANDHYVTKIINGGYYDFVVNPGKIDFTNLAGLSVNPTVVIALLSNLDGQAPLCSLQAEPNQTYYFKFEIGDKMGPVSKEEAIKSMTGMHRFDDPENNTTKP